MIELDRSVEYSGAKIKIIGVGGGGGNAVNSMIERGLSGVEFLVVNTDMQALAKNLSPLRVQVGKQLTRGLGAGANPEVGRDAAHEDRDELGQVLSGCDMVFVTAGMGGGTGTGAAPVVAEVARQQGALVVGIVTRPFEWEGKRRKDQAESGIADLREHVDTLIVIPNQKLLSIIDKKTGFKEAFQKVDDVLYNATRGIAQIITGHGVVNVDFADVRTVMQNMGDALMGTGSASGEFRAAEAAQNAISSPLLDGISITGSEQVLINISASSDMTMMEVDEAVQIVHQAVGPDANVIFGVVLDDELEETMMVTVIATGFNKAGMRQQAPRQNNTVQMQAPQQVQQQAPQPMQQPQPLYGQQPSQQQPIQQQPTQQEPAQQQPATQQPQYQQPQVARPAAPPSRDQQMPDRVPQGQQELQQYNTPAYLRRTGGTGQGGFTIPRNQEPPAPEQNEAEEETPQLRKQASADKPAFLRRIMD